MATDNTDAEPSVPEPWLDLWKEVDEDDEQEYDPNIPSLNPGDERTSWQSLDAGTQRRLLDGIQNWRDCEINTQRPIQLVNEGFRACQGGEDDNDDWDNFYTVRPTLEQWRQQVRTFITSRCPQLMTSISEFYKFCPSEAVEHYLAQKREQYGTLLTTAAADLQDVETNLAEIQAAIRARLEHREMLQQGILDPAAGWFGYWPFSGGFQTAADPPALWLRQDKQGNLIDRIVVKDGIFPQHNNPLYWYKGIVGGVPLEIKMLYELRSLLGSNTIIKIRNWRPWLITQPDNGERGYRQYLEYCPFSDLESLVYKRGQSIYAVPPLRITQPNHDHFGDDTVSMLPEPMIWYTLENLTTAGLLMERGELAKHGMREWTLLVHRDIKLDNIFLGAQNSKRYSRYPEPKLGDWGFVQQITPEIQAHPDQLDGGTHGWCPPELRDKLVPESRTNVWSLGQVAWCMVMAQPNGSQDNMDPHPRRIDASAQNYYSAELLELIQRCTQESPTDRPTFDELKVIINRHTAKPGPDNRVREIRNKAFDDDAWDDAAVRLPEEFRREKYKLGFALSEADRGDVNVPPPPTIDVQDDTGGPMARPVKRRRFGNT